ncbi:hypothetical protein PN456_17095 [Nodularia spumigena CS-586/05]|uniref:hypothetical protein n=1 Tax=Nodularia spumigena TaxID=70799 RepID=UPI00232B7080|nr:hypothetical protein [Nodularia spumigena]MDB9342735.1 hypothetical protein [Nodularia spumigena CS-588/06]MDB9370643.1 hypothetical protein [Nodularia spumigena CS-586/05]
MPHHDYPPAYLRYFKAGLWNLAKPSFWGGAIVLSVIGLGIGEYWSNRKISTNQPKEEVTSLQSDNSALSPEDKAITANLDNLPGSFDVKPGNLAIIPNLPPAKSQDNDQDNLLEELKKQLSEDSTASNPQIETFNSTSPPPGKNPFVLETEKLLQSGTFNVNSQPLGISSLATSSPSTGTPATSPTEVNQTENSQNPNSISFSQTPVNPASNQSLSGFNGEIANPINSLDKTAAGGVMQIPSNNGLPSQGVYPRTGLNAATGVQPTVGVPNNLPPNSVNQVNSIEGLPSPVQPTTVTSPLSSGVESGVQTNFAPNSSIQAPSPDIVAPMSPVVADNNGNLIWRSPAQQMQPNSLDSQIPGQNRGLQDIDLSNLDF